MRRWTHFTLGARRCGWRLTLARPSLTQVAELGLVDLRAGFLVVLKTALPDTDVESDLPGVEAVTAAP